MATSTPVPPSRRPYRWAGWRRRTTWPTPACCCVRRWPGTSAARTSASTAVARGLGARGRHGECEEGGGGARGGGEDGGLVGAEDDDGDPPPAVAADQVRALPDAALQGTGDLLQARVSGGVAVVVVVPLEVVDIDHRDPDRGSRGEPGTPGRRQHVVEAAPVGQSGQRIGEAEGFELSVGRLKFPGSLGDRVLQTAVEQGVVQRDGELPGDEHDRVEPLPGEGAAAEPILHEEHRPHDALV